MLFSITISRTRSACKHVVSRAANVYHMQVTPPPSSASHPPVLLHGGHKSTIYSQAERVRDYVREKRTYSIDEIYKCENFRKNM